MPRKTAADGVARPVAAVASMRPRPDAAENNRGPRRTGRRRAKLQ